MLGLDLSELLIICVVALVVFGPEKLPEISRSIGKMMGSLRRTSDTLRREFYNDLYPPAGELTRELRDASRGLKAVGQEIKATVEEPVRSEASAISSALTGLTASTSGQAPGDPAKGSEQK